MRSSRQICAVTIEGVVVESFSSADVASATEHFATYAHMLPYTAIPPPGAAGTRTLIAISCALASAAGIRPTSSTVPWQRTGGVFLISLSRRAVEESVAELSAGARVLITYEKKSIAPEWFDGFLASYSFLKELRYRLMVFRMTKLSKII